MEFRYQLEKAAQKRVHPSGRLHDCFGGFLVRSLHRRGTDEESLYFTRAPRRLFQPLVFWLKHRRPFFKPDCLLFRFPSCTSCPFPLPNSPLRHFPLAGFFSRRARCWAFDAGGSRASPERGFHTRRPIDAGFAASVTEKINKTATSAEIIPGISLDVEVVRFSVACTQVCPCRS